MNTRQEAIEGIKAYYRQFGDKGTELMIYELLRRIGDMNLFALYYQLYGHAVGEKAVRS